MSIQKKKSPKYIDTKINKYYYQQNTLIQRNWYVAYIGKNVFLCVYTKNTVTSLMSSTTNPLLIHFCLFPTDTFVLELNWISCLQPWLLFCSFRLFFFSSGSNFLFAYIFAQLSALSPSLRLTFISLNLLFLLLQ